MLAGRGRAAQSWQWHAGARNSILHAGAAESSSATQCRLREVPPGAAAPLKCGWAVHSTTETK